MRALSGVKVLEFTQALSGPFCGMMLADMGAEVIKLERPPLGDSSRYNAPGKGGTTASFSNRNRGKKSVLVDLSDEKQREFFLRMVVDADIIIENFKPGTMEKYNCGYDVLKSIKPDIILTSISGYGQTGPFKSRAAYDVSIQAESGCLSITGTRDGELTTVGYSFVDTIAGLTAGVATLAALRKRDATGEGQHVDISMLDSLIATMEVPFGRYYMTGVNPKPEGVGTPLSAPFSLFPIKGGRQVLLCCNTDIQWSKLCHVLGCPELIDDPRFNSGSQRKKHEDELIAAMIPYTQKREDQELCEAMEKEHLIYGHVNNIGDIVETEQFQARNMKCRIHYPDLDVVIPATGSAIKMSGEAHETDYTAHTLGYDTIVECAKYLGEEAAHNIYDTVLEESRKKAAGMMNRANII